jgi:polar amino acid transport system substrate-binding protein
MLSCRTWRGRVGTTQALALLPGAPISHKREKCLDKFPFTGILVLRLLEEDEPYTLVAVWIHGDADCLQTMQEGAIMTTMLRNVGLCGLVVWLSFMACSGMPVHAEERKTITFADLVYPPFFFDDGTGATPDMLTAIFDQMGYDVIVEVYPFARAIAMVNAGQRQAILCFPGQTDPERTVASKPLFYSSNVFIYKKSQFPDGISFQTLSDLAGYRVGNLIGSTRFERLFEEHGLVVDLASSDTFNLKKLDSGRVDLVMTVHLMGRALLESTFPADRLDEFAFTAPFEILPNVINFSTTYPGNAALIEEFTQTIEDIDLAEILHTSYGKYFLDGQVPPYFITGTP